MPLMYGQKRHNEVRLPRPFHAADGHVDLCTSGHNLLKTIFSDFSVYD